MVEVYAIRIDDFIDDNTINQLLSYIPKEKREQVKRFHFIEDVKRTLYGDLMVRYLACDKLKLSNSQIIFCKNEFGKPFLKDHADFYFNISHSGDWVVCAIGKREVGIDIEQIKPVDISIAKRFFTEIEYKDLMRIPERFRVERFYNFWTMKESYIKYKGEGLSIPLNSFHVPLESGGLDNLPYLYFSQPLLDTGYKLSIYSEDGPVSEKIIIMDINLIKEKLIHGN